MTPLGALSAGKVLQGAAVRGIGCVAYTRPVSLISHELPCSSMERQRVEIRGMVASP